MASLWYVTWYLVQYMVVGTRDLSTVMQLLLHIPRVLGAMHVGDSDIVPDTVALLQPKTSTLYVT